MKFRVLILINLCLFSGCVSRWSEKLCTETKFVDLGHQEGSAGKNNVGSYYNQACLKKKIQISMSDYNLGYKRGLTAFCFESKGFDSGSAGKGVFNNCRTVKAYIEGYGRGLRNFCSTKRGVKDGFTMKSEYVLCTSVSAYTLGYLKGKKEYCSSARGYEQGFTGDLQDQRCVGYSHYKSGFTKGKKHFCSSENGRKIGKKGENFPSRCKSKGVVFKKNFDKGRVMFLMKVLKNKETAVAFERQNYERIRDNLQDTHLALNRLSKHVTDIGITNEKARINSSILGFQRKRDFQKKIVQELESQIQNIKKEMNNLKEM